MASTDSKPAPRLLTTPRIATLLGSILVALGSGTNYIYSAYSPQLGARLHISHTQLNVVGLAGNTGVYLFGPLWGRVVDANGPRFPLIGAAVCFLLGYLGIRRVYDDGPDAGISISSLRFVLLVTCGFLTGLGAPAGLGAAVSVTAKSFPESARATTTGLVVSGFGLSAFCFSTLAHIFFPGDTSALLLILGLTTSLFALVGLLVVRPVPLPSLKAYDNIAHNSTAEIDCRTPLLGDRLQDNAHQCDSSSETELGRVRSKSWSEESSLLDIHGKRLWTSTDFYLIISIMALLSGTGLMYINNVGSISQALYGHLNPDYEEVEASKWQAAQVSTLSMCNFAGRIMIGLISDFMRTRLHLPRAYCLCIVSLLFIISQGVALEVSSVKMLWSATALLGLAYGSLFSIAYTIVIDWFGIAHLTENWGYVALAPLIFGNLFSLMFGRELDAHTAGSDQRVPLATGRESALVDTLQAAIPLERRCMLGRECYTSSLRITLMACVVALVLSVWAGIRDVRRERQR